MKKTLFTIAAILLSLSFQSCRETVPPETLEDEEPATENTEANTVTGINLKEKGQQTTYKG